MEPFRKKNQRKKKIKKKEKTTIPFKHKTIIENFNTKIRKAPGIRAQLTKLEKEKETIDPSEVAKQLSIDKSIHTLQSHLNADSEKKDYLLNSSHLLFDYYDNSSQNNSSNVVVLDFFSKAKTTAPQKKTRRTEIMMDYMKLTDSQYVKTIYTDTEYIKKCQQCEVHRILKSKKGVLICPKCGSIEKILTDNTTASYKDPPREITYFAYKKINHANEFLSQFQAKESTVIDKKIYDLIKSELNKERYLNIRKITPNKIREILKKLHLTKYYEHSHYITNRLSGNPPPTLNNDLEEKLRNMFRQIQSSWIKHCPSNRANFFSYPYVFYKFFELLEEDKYLPYCRLLKSREKLHEHDEVWKKICEELRWEYIPTV
tara:strand:- start:8132 stop:9250 length:1119 start_codon:yes stop_codon:yes gene_type:complete